jgi:hypothetical protein
VPWIIALGHKPFYCSVDWRLPVPDPHIGDSNYIPTDEDSEKFEESLGGMGGNANYNCYGQAMYTKGFLEQIFYENGVDIYFSGHVHNFERMSAIYNNQTVPGDYDGQHL